MEGYGIGLATAALMFGFAGCAGSGDAGFEEEGEGGEGDRYARARAAMVKVLRHYGITDERVLDAMGAVPRHHFVPKEIRGIAYRDSALPIDHEQTISQPYIVAFMTEQLRPQPGDTVLEVGTGSGYQAAILSRLVKQVYSVEIVEELAAQATQTLADGGFDNVAVRHGDGYRGWPEHAPFDAIIVTCAPDEIPEPLVEQLKEGGRMIIPVGDAGSQQLYLLEKRGGEVKRTDVLDVRFVPMTGEAQGD